MPWVQCTVERVGPADESGTPITYIALRATDGSLYNWYKAGTLLRKEMLATALAAISSNKEVTAYLDDVAAYSTIWRLYVLR